MRKNWRNVVAAAICSAVLMTFTGCPADGEDDILKNADISLSNKNDAKQSAFADDASTGQGFTFTAKDDWLASVKETGSKGSGGNAAWIKLTLNGVETNSGSAGTYTLVITIETNYTGERREATVEIVCGADRISVTVTQEGTTKGGEMPKQDPVELKSPISVNTTLKKLGMPVDYVYNGNDFLYVTGTAVLTIEPGVTIQFANTGRAGGLFITSSATIKAEGTAGERIRFIGAVEAAGSWQGITIESKTDNRFDYCDFLNMGNSSRTDYGGMQLSGAKAGITHCKFTNGLGTGLYAVSGGSYAEFSAFDNNVFEGYENEAPVNLYTNQSLTLLEKFDMTSDFTRNAKQYIQVSPDMTKDVTLSQSTVPYYFLNNSNAVGTINNTLTINEGVTIYIANGIAFNNGFGVNNGRLMINGTASKKVKFTRLPGTSGYWDSVEFNGLKGSVINHCIFEYGGVAYLSGSGILALGSTTELTLNNVEINNSNNYGVYLSGTNYKLTHSNVTFSNNSLGNVYMDNWPNSGVQSHFP